VTDIWQEPRSWYVVVVQEGKKRLDEEKLAEARSSIKLMCVDDIIKASDKTVLDQQLLKRGIKGTSTANMRAKMRLIIQHEKVEVEIPENFGKKGGRRVAKHENISAPSKKAAKVEIAKANDETEWDGELLEWANTQEPDAEAEKQVAEIPAVPVVPATKDNPDESDSGTNRSSSSDSDSSTSSSSSSDSSSSSSSD
jgi:hypothetical protein